MGGPSKKTSGETQDTNVQEVLQNAAAYFEGIEHTGLAELVGIARELVFQLAPMNRRNGRWFLKKGASGYISKLLERGDAIQKSLGSIEEAQRETNAKLDLIQQGGSARVPPAPMDSGESNNPPESASSDDSGNQPGASPHEEEASMPPIDLSDITVEDLQAVNKSKRKEMLQALDACTDYKVGDITDNGQVVVTNDALRSAMKWRNGRWWKVTAIAGGGIVAGAAVVETLHRTGVIGASEEGGEVVELSRTGTHG